MNRDPISKTSLNRLNPRQRKKLRVGEFQEFVFEVRAWFHQAMAGAAYDQFLDAFIEMIEAQNLCVGGRDGRLPLLQTDGVISTAYPSECSHSFQSNRVQ